MVNVQAFAYPADDAPTTEVVVDLLLSTSVLRHRRDHTQTVHYLIGGDALPSCASARDPWWRWAPGSHCYHHHHHGVALTLPGVEVVLDCLRKEPDEVDHLVCLQVYGLVAPLDPHLDATHGRADLQDLIATDEIPRPLSNDADGHALLECHVRSPGSRTGCSGRG